MSNEVGPFLALFKVPKFSCDLIKKVKPGSKCKIFKIFVFVFFSAVSSCYVEHMPQFLAVQNF